ncbi:MAG TPA: hypothetical protein VHW06_05300 [Streptosporangiaceae bacterium]|jgi:streptogramin lyase|nr:hypothetical protein [Streptosporangiaceae bacterium]
MRTRARWTADVMAATAGLAVAPDGTVWTAVNNRDNVTYPSHSSYKDTSHPAGSLVTIPFVADAVAGPDGALYVSDDTAGAIYRLVPPKSAS